MKFEVVTTVWGADGEAFPGGVHEVEKPTNAFLDALGSAEAAGVVVVLDATAKHRTRLNRAVQSQADGEKAYTRMQEQGRWQHGNLQQAILDREARLDDEHLPADDAAAISLELNDLRERFAATGVPE